jgi:prepilin-type processing-associated H-X9-DG protein
MSEQMPAKIVASAQPLQAEAAGLALSWMPPKVKGDETKCISALLKIRKIKASQNKKLNRFIFSTSRDFYRKYLKQFAPARWIVQCIWRSLYPFYLNFSFLFLRTKERRWRPLISFSAYSKMRGLATYKLTDAECVITPAPMVFPVEDQSYLESPHDQYDFPEVSVMLAENAMVYGGSNFVFVDGSVVCHDLFDVVRDYTSEELHGRAIVSPRLKRIRWLLHDEEPEKLSIAATFVDACAPNYAHWMTEVLPRIALFCADERHKKIPIVINDGLHENIIHSLLDVAGFERKIFALPVGKAIAVNELYITSVAGYVPFERRKNKAIGHSHGKFNPNAFDVLASCLGYLDNKIEEENWPEKIFIRRNSGARIVINSREIEELLVTQGYEIVEPEKLTFSQQVQLFRNAKVVVASSGAALANMVFLPHDAQIIVLIGKYPDTSYWYWQNLACASGNVIKYCLGESTKGVGGGIHSDFFIKISDISNIL